MKKFIYKAVPLLVASQMALAVPTIYPENIEALARIENPTNSNLVADTVNPLKAYVLPPNTGEAKVSGLHTISANVGYCGEMSDLQKISRSLTGRMAQLADQEASSKKSLDEIQRQLDAARVDATQFVTEKKLLALSDLDLRISDMTDRLSSLYKEIETCKNSCDGMSTEITRLEKEKHQLEKDRRALANQNIQDSREYDRKMAKVDALKENLKDARESYMELISSLSKIQQDFRGMFDRFGRMEAGRAAFVYDSGWEENIATLRSRNPGVEFEEIPTQNAKIFASIKGAKDIPGDLAILAYELGGEQKDGYVDLKSGFQSRLSSNIVLSLLGACPMLHPLDFGLPADYSSDNMKYGMTIGYEFPTNTKLKLTATYNMYKMYNKIVSSGSSGGFFSSHSWTNVEERNRFSDSFHVAWDQTDPDNQIPDDQRFAMETEMKKSIFERMALYALPSSPDRNSILQASPPPDHGAVVLSDSLMKACPGNIYCVGGALAMSVLDAIFGNSSATANYLQVYNTDLTESWENNKVVYKPWVTTFSPQ